MKIKILGPACVNCERTALNIHKTLEEMKIQADVEEVREPKRILMHSISSTPAVLIDEKVACEGRVPNTAEIKEWLEQMKNWSVES